ncbi:MAG: hypothetical protein M3P18_02830 [Actinomycetota bacterium]|nr:hypothetical protein [Actinomycetota bacterium]
MTTVAVTKASRLNRTFQLIPGSPFIRSNLALRVLRPKCGPGLTGTRRSVGPHLKGVDGEWQLFAVVGA